MQRRPIPLGPAPLTLAPRPRPSLQFRPSARTGQSRPATRITHSLERRWGDKADRRRMRVRNRRRRRRGWRAGLRALGHELPYSQPLMAVTYFHLVICIALSAHTVVVSLALCISTAPSNRPCSQLTPSSHPTEPTGMKCKS